MSLILHLLALTGMVLGLKVATPPPEDRALELRLVPAPTPEPQPRPAPVQRSSERPNAAPPLRPRPSPSPSAEASIAAPLKLPAPPAPVPAPDAGPKGLLPSLSGRMGCDEVLGIRLTPEQQQACANNWARMAREAKPLGLDIPDGKKADYDRNVHCRQVYTGRPGVPPSTEYDASGHVKTGPAAGLGYIPTLKECPVRDR